MNDVFTIQDEISEAIAGKLRIHLLGDRPLVKKATENIEAYILYLKGRYIFYRGEWRNIRQNAKNIMKKP